MSVQFYSQITKDTHPAVPYVLKLMNAQKEKNLSLLKSCFKEGLPLFINLPGGLIMHDSKELIDRHKRFYESHTFSLKYEDLKQGMGNDQFFTCSVLVHVTLPEGNTRKNTIDLTFIQMGTDEWFPVRLINTVIDPTK